MAQALSEEEFQRMQAQLLELRTRNYQLSDELRKQTAEMNSLRLKSTNVEKDLAKAQKAVTKSKKAQEVDALLSENEMLQGKLHSQEDDFRLQNSTLMQELSKLCAQIEELEAENKQLKEKAPGSDCSPAGTPVDGELLRLQAENTALQRNLAALQHCYDQEVQATRHGEDREANGSEVAILDGQGVDGSTREDVADEMEKEAQEPSKAALEKMEQLESKCAKLEQKLKDFNEMQLKWAMELEEKRLVKEQLQTLEMSKQSELSKLQEEVSKLSEKLKKKQESFLRLQTEKEALYNDSRTKIDEIQQRRDEELKALTARNQRLQQEAQASNQSLSDLKEHLQKVQKEHEAVVQGVRDQMECQSAECQEQVESVLSENDALRTGLAALEQIQTAKAQEVNQLRDQVTSLTLDIQQRQGEVDGLVAERDDLNSQLQVRSSVELLPLGCRLHHVFSRFETFGVTVFSILCRPLLPVILMTVLCAWRLYHTQLSRQVCVLDDCTGHSCADVCTVYLPTVLRAYRLYRAQPRRCLYCIPADCPACLPTVPCTAAPMSVLYTCRLSCVPTDCTVHSCADVCTVYLPTVLRAYRLYRAQPRRCLYCIPADCPACLPTVPCTAAPMSVLYTYRLYRAQPRRCLYCIPADCPACLPTVPGTAEPMSVLYTCRLSCVPTDCTVHSCADDCPTGSHASGHTARPYRVFDRPSETGLTLR
ncbi:GRIP1-associated protein 1-like [Hemitrygon akajei]|uniref:GRIP1-associated protein 1-like n=1 Tax=Hemitrygon akajei TaxID=2704970 RepID=UPI003BF9D67C